MSANTVSDELLEIANKALALVREVSKIKVKDYEGKRHKEIKAQIAELNARTRELKRQIRAGGKHGQSKR